MSENFSLDMLGAIAARCRRLPGDKLHVTTAQLLTVGIATLDQFAAYTEREGLSYLATVERGRGGYLVWKEVA